MIEFNYLNVKQTSNIKELLDIVFKTEKQSEIAVAIIEKIKKQGNIYDKDMKYMAKNAKCSETWFYNRILKQLLKIGMVKKDFNQYSLSKTFSNSLRKFERSWESIV